MRRQRLHELLIALIQKQEDFALLDPEAPLIDGSTPTAEKEPGRWLERNQRILRKYQALIRSAVTLESLMDIEDTDFDNRKNY